MWLWVYYDKIPIIANILSTSGELYISLVFPLYVTLPFRNMCTWEDPEGPKGRASRHWAWVES